MQKLWLRSFKQIQAQRILHTAVGGIIQDAVGEVKNALEGLPEDELE